MPTPIQDPISLQKSCRGLNESVLAISRSLSDAKKELAIAQDIAKSDWTVALLRTGHVIYLLKATSTSILTVASEFGPKNVQVLACSGLAGMKIAEQGSRYISGSGNALDTASGGLELASCVTKGDVKILLKSKQDMADMISDAQKYDKGQISGGDFAVGMLARVTNRALEHTGNEGLAKKKNKALAIKRVVKEGEELVKSFSDIERDIANYKSIKEQEFRRILRNIEMEEKRLEKAINELQKCAVEMNLG